MIKLDFNFKVFITLFVLCIASIVFSTIAIDKQIDSYIEEMRTEIEIVNNSNDEITVVQNNNTITITVNSIKPQQLEEITIVNEEESYGLVTSVSGLNIRQNPSVDSNKVGVLTYGSKIKLLEECGDWYKTEEGYIFKEYVIKI